VALGERMNKKILLDGVLFDSKMEAEAFCLLKGAGLVGEALEGSNIHVKLHRGRQSIEVDFLLVDGTFLDIHHFSEDEDRDLYLMNREWMVPGEYVVVGDLVELRETFLL